MKSTAKEQVTLDASATQLADNDPLRKGVSVQIKDNLAAQQQSLVNIGLISSIEKTLHVLKTCVVVDVDLEWKR